MRLALTCAVIAALTLAYSRCSNITETLAPTDIAKIYALDGDSFRMFDGEGWREIRLKAIDAPEYQQNCEDKSGRAWHCGKHARATLQAMLLQRGLTCAAGSQDRFGRSIATCRNSHIADIAAAQVVAGMAVTQEFNSTRPYGKEEDSARNQRRGIWQGNFIHPRAWRDTHLKNNKSAVKTLGSSSR